MGRWSQQHRRGGGGGAPPPPPPPALTVTSFGWSPPDAVYFVGFSGPITYDASGLLDGVLNGFESVNACVQVNATTVEVTFPTVTGAGTFWQVIAQPSQITEGIAFPESGFSS